MTSQAVTNAAGVPEQLVEALAATPGADDWQCAVQARRRGADVPHRDAPSRRCGR